MSDVALTSVNLGSWGRRRIRASNANRFGEFRVEFEGFKSSEKRNSFHCSVVAFAGENNYVERSLLGGLSH